MTSDMAFVLTPPGSGAIAVVRVIGPRAGDFLRVHFTGRPAAGRCAYGEIKDGERVIDDAVAVLSDDNSTADLNIHGGPWVVETVVNCLRKFGFATAGTPANGFIPLAALDGADLLEQEMLAAIPLAQTELALEILLAQPRAWRAFLSQMYAGDGVDRIERMLADRGLYWLLHPPIVAIVGAANVGKSTLANQLFGQERSITADLPGTTRDWIGESANFDGLAVKLLDTPGVRATDDPLERAAIEQALHVVAEADLVLLVADASRPIAEQQSLMDAYPSSMLILNKVDRAIATRDLPEGAIATVATTGHGVEALRAAVRARFQCPLGSDDSPRWWTPRQRDLLCTASKSLDF